MTTVVSDIKLDFCDVLIRPKRSALTSREEPIIERTFSTRWNGWPGEKWSAGVPLIASNMDHTGTIEMAKALHGLNCHTTLDKHILPKHIVNMFRENPNLLDRVWITLGISESDVLSIEWIRKELQNNIYLLCLDVANGYQESFASFISEVRSRLSPCIIMAGNVATPEMTEHLILSGADIVKIGIGPGSACITRKVAGVGYPQLSAIMECADAAHGLSALICADGGCTCSGDIAKAYGAGADFVMLGGMLAGHSQCKGIQTEDGMEFYGMSSREALEKYSGGPKSHRAPEGKKVVVPVRGPVENTVQDILRGIRSTMTYVGARSLKDLSKCTTFIRVNRQLNNVFGE